MILESSLTMVYWNNCSTLIEHIKMTWQKRKRACDHDFKSAVFCVNEPSRAFPCSHDFLKPETAHFDSWKKLDCKKDCQRAQGKKKKEFACQATSCFACVCVWWKYWMVNAEQSEKYLTWWKIWAIKGELEGKETGSSRKENLFSSFNPVYLLVICSSLLIHYKMCIIKQICTDVPPYNVLYPSVCVFWVCIKFHTISTKKKHF